MRSLRSAEDMRSRFARWLNTVKSTGRTVYMGCLYPKTYGDGSDGDDGKKDPVTLRYPGRRALAACNTT